MLVGAKAALDLGGVDAGLAYLFDLVSGDLLYVFQGVSPGPAGLFGHAIALNDKHALVGAHGDDPERLYEVTSGVAYLFDAETGILVSKFTNPVQDGSTHFGSAVAISETHVLIGAPRAGLGGQSYLFDLQTGGHLHTFELPDEVEDAGFG